MGMDSVGGDDPFGDPESFGMLKKGPIPTAPMQKPKVAPLIKQTLHGRQQGFAIFFRGHPAAAKDQRAACRQLKSSLDRWLGRFRGREYFRINPIYRNDIDRFSNAMPSDNIREVLAEHDVLPPNQAIHTRQSMKYPQFASPKRLIRARMRSSATVISLGRTAHQHRGGGAGEATGKICGQRGEAVALDKNKINPLSILAKVSPDKHRKLEPRSRSYNAGHRNRRRVAHLDATLNFTCQDRKVERFH
jgi:hypothetical protein